MDIFLILQILFDAVLLFGVLFVFHFSVHQSDKKKEEADVLKNVQIQEIKENLQELLMILKQLGKEVSENIQEQVREAEEKTDLFKRTVQKLQKDLDKAIELADEVNGEKKRLEDKMKVMRTTKKKSPIPPSIEEHLFSSGKFSLPSPPSEPRTKEDGKINTPKNTGSAIGYSSGVVREVYRLADAEMVLSEIVRRTKLSRAEIQLILNLRGNRFTTPN
jgi:hypothetical protein